MRKMTAKDSLDKLHLEAEEREVVRKAKSATIPSLSDAKAIVDYMIDKRVIYFRIGDVEVQLSESAFNVGTKAVQALAESDERQKKKGKKPATAETPFFGFDEGSSGNGSEDDDLMWST